MLGLDDARRVIDAVLEQAMLDPRHPIAVAVADVDGDVIAFARMDGAGHLPRDMAVRKAYTSARMGADTGPLSARMQSAGVDLKDLGDARLSGFAGGVAVRSNGAVVGAVGVSGRSAEEDEVLARLGVDAIDAALGGG